MLLDASRDPYICIYSVLGLEFFLYKVGRCFNITDFPRIHVRSFFYELKVLIF